MNTHHTTQWDGVILANKNKKKSQIKCMKSPLYIEYWCLIEHHEYDGAKQKIKTTKMEYTFYSILLCFMIFVLFWCVPPDARYIGAVTMEQSTDRDSSAYRYHIICYIHICPWLFSISKHMHMLMVGCVGYFFIIKKISDWYATMMMSLTQ